MSNHVEPGPTPRRVDVALPPERIVEYELPTTRRGRGYEQAAVDDLLDELAAQTAGLLRRVDELRAERDRLTAQLEQSTDTESTLTRTLVTAQRAAEEAVREAQGQADTIRQRAVERAEELLRRAADQAEEMREAAVRRARADEADARRRRRGLDDHVEQLRAFVDDHRERVAHHLRAQLARLDELETPEPPPAGERAEDPVLAEPVLDRSVDEMVAEIVDEVPPGAPPATPPPAQLSGAPPGPPPMAQSPAVDDLLAQVDDAAAEASREIGVPPADPPSSDPASDTTGDDTSDDVRADPHDVDGDGAAGDGGWTDGRDGGWQPLDEDA